MLGFILSVLVFCGVIATFSFIVNATTKSSNEPVTSFISSSELCAVKPVHTVQTVETVSQVHTETTIESLAETASEQPADVIDSVFNEIENEHFSETAASFSQIDANASVMLDELFNELGGVSLNEQEQVNEVISNDEKTPVVTEILTDVAEDKRKTLTQSELEHLSALYGHDTMDKVTTTPALGRIGEKDVMIGRVEKNDNKYYLAYDNARVEVSKAAFLFVGEMVIVSGTYVNETFFKVSHIELAAQSTEGENTSIYDEVI